MRSAFPNAIIPGTGFFPKNPRNFPSRVFKKILFPVLSQSRHSGLAKYACAHLYTSKADSKKRLFNTIFTDYCKTALVVTVMKTVHFNFARKILLLKFCCSIFTVFLLKCLDQDWACWVVEVGKRLSDTNRCMGTWSQPFHLASLPKAWVHSCNFLVIFSINLNGTL